MTARRGRPPTGVRKAVVQVPLDPDDAQMLDDAAEVMGRARADVGRALIKGEMAWADVVKASRKVRK
jgi:hypothetical protein